MIYTEVLNRLTPSPTTGRVEDNMSNSRRWKEFITWWNLQRRQTDFIDVETLKDKIDVKIREICRNEAR